MIIISAPTPPATPPAMAPMFVPPPPPESEGVGEAVTEEVRVGLNVAVEDEILVIVDEDEVDVTARASIGYTSWIRE